MVPRADELIGAMFRILLIVIGAWAFSQVAQDAYQGAMRLVLAALGG